MPTLLIKPFSVSIKCISQKQKEENLLKSAFCAVARRKTIYEYHRVTFGYESIENSSIIALKALPSCLQFTDCQQCAMAEMVTKVGDLLIVLMRRQLICIKMSFVIFLKCPSVCFYGKFFSRFFMQRIHALAKFFEA